VLWWKFHLLADASKCSVVVLFNNSLQKYFLPPVARQVGNDILAVDELISDGSLF
jgi:hypothetical protein